MATPGVKENEFRSWLKGNFQNRGWHVTTIETSTKAGVPDMYVATPRLSFWLELKIGITPAPLVRKEQRVWGHLHAKAGGKAFVVYYNHRIDKIVMYQHPIKEVEQSGKYLMPKDEPVLRCNYWDFVRELARYLNI